MTNSNRAANQTPPPGPITQIFNKPFNEIPARIGKIHFDGISRTADDMLMNMAQKLFTVTNYDEMMQKATELKRTLAGLHCFKQIGIVIDVSRDKNAGKHDYEIIYKVVENRRLFGGINTFVGNNNDGCVAVNVNFPNLAGRGEYAQLMYQYGTQKTTGVSLDFIKPLAPWSAFDPKLSGSIFQNAGDFPYSGYHEIDRGVGVELKLRYSPIITHNLRWEGIWRDLKALSDSPFEVREEAGHTLKSSIKQTLTVDQREIDFIPISGTFYQLKQEYAGIGGNINFHKHEAEVQHNLNITKFITDSVIQIGLRGGIMKSLTKTCITDRFFLGGPMTLRGFELNGLGPHAEGSALGATTYWVANLHLYTPLPFRLGKGSFGDYFRTHLFINSGNIGNFNFTGDYYRDTSLLLNKVRFSAGVGIVMQLPSGARLEFHCCLPINEQFGDRPDKGLQFGLGAQFV